MFKFENSMVELTLLLMWNFVRLIKTIDACFHVEPRVDSLTGSCDRVIEVYGYIWLNVGYLVLFMFSQTNLPTELFQKRFFRITC